MHIALWRAMLYLCFQNIYYYYFFKSLVALVKLMSTLILFVHNSSWEITTLLFYSNYIKYIRFVLKKSNHFFVSFFQNLLPHVTIHKVYLDSQTIIALNLRSFNSLCFCLEESISMDHEWMETFFISLILYVLFEQQHIQTLYVFVLKRVTRVSCFKNIKHVFQYFSFYHIEFLSSVWEAH